MWPHCGMNSKQPVLKLSTRPRPRAVGSVGKHCFGSFSGIWTFVLWSTPLPAQSSKTLWTLALWGWTIGCIALAGCQSEQTQNLGPEPVVSTASSTQDIDSGPPSLDAASAPEGLQEPSPASEKAEAKVLSGPGHRQQGRSAGWLLWRGDPAGTGVAPHALPQTLEPLWTFHAPQGGFEVTTVIAHGNAYLGTTDGPFYAIELATGKKRWEFTEGAGYLAPASVCDELLFVGDLQGRFFALRCGDGTLAWQFDSEAEIDGAANFFDAHLVFGSQDGVLYCLERASGRLVWKYQSADQIRCFPTLWGRLALVAGCDGSLHGIDLHTGKPAAEVNLEGPTGCTPAVLDDQAFVGTEAHRFLAIALKQAKVLWTFESPKSKQSFRSSAAVTKEAVYVGCRDRHLYALNPQTGHILWQFATQGQVDSSPVVVGDRVYVGSSDGRLYSLDRKTGKAVWQFELGGQVVASPAVADGYLVIGNTNGQLYCFGPHPNPD